MLDQVASIWGLGDTVMDTAGCTVTAANSSDIDTILRGADIFTVANTILRGADIFTVDHTSLRGADILKVVDIIEDTVTDGGFVLII